MKFSWIEISILWGGEMHWQENNRSRLWTFGGPTQAHLTREEKIEIFGSEKRWFSRLRNLPNNLFLPLHAARQYGPGFLVSGSRINCCEVIPVRRRWEKKEAMIMKDTFVTHALVLLSGIFARNWCSSTWKIKLVVGYLFEETYRNSAEFRPLFSLSELYVKSNICNVSIKLGNTLLTCKSLYACY